MNSLRLHLVKPCGIHLRQQRPHDFPVDIGEAVVAALVAEGETLVVDAELVHQRGVQVVDRNLVFYD